MENEGGKIDKWTIPIWWQNIDLNQCDILNYFFLYFEIFGWNPTGPSYVNMTENWYNKDDLTMPYKHGDNEEIVVKVQVGIVTG